MKRIIFLIVFLFLIFSLEAKQLSLKEIYQKGSVRACQELIINEDSLHEDILILQPRSIVEDNFRNIYILDYQANNIKK